MEKARLDELKMKTNEKWNMAKTLREAANKILEVANTLDIEAYSLMYKTNKAKKTKIPLMKKSSKKFVIG